MSRRKSLFFKQLHREKSKRGVWICKSFGLHDLPNIMLTGGTINRGRRFLWKGYLTMANGQRIAFGAIDPHPLSIVNYPFERAARRKSRPQSRPVARHPAGESERNLNMDGQMKTRFRRIRSCPSCDPCSNAIRIGRYRCSWVAEDAFDIPMQHATGVNATK